MLHSRDKTAISFAAGGTRHHHGARAQTAHRTSRTSRGHYSGSQGGVHRTNETQLVALFPHAQQVRVDVLARQRCLCRRAEHEERHQILLVGKAERETDTP